MLPSRQRPTTSPTPQRGHEALVESTESFPLDGLLDAIRHTRVKGIGSTLGLQTCPIKKTHSARRSTLKDMDFDRIKRMADGDNTNTTETTSNKILRHQARRRVPFTHSRSDLEDWAIKRLCGRETGKEGNSRNRGGFGKRRRTLLFSLALRLLGRFPMHHASNLCNTFSVHFHSSPSVLNLNKCGGRF